MPCRVMRRQVWLVQLFKLPRWFCWGPVRDEVVSLVGHVWSPRLSPAMCIGERHVYQFLIPRPGSVLWVFLCRLYSPSTGSYLCSARKKEAEGWVPWMRLECHLTAACVALRVTENYFKKWKSSTCVLIDYKMSFLVSLLFLFALAVPYGPEKNQRNRKADHCADL
jgi:hypothetical protein